MTQETFIDPADGQSRRRGRGPSNPIPAMPFEDSLVLPKGILEYGIGGEIDRLTLLGKLERSPTANKTRELISSSYKYGLTSGSFSASVLKVTDDGRALLTPGASERELKEKQFELAIRQFDHFNNLYDKLKNQRLRDETVIRSEFGRIGIPDEDRQRAADVFTANLRFIGLVKYIADNEFVGSIEQVVEEASAVPEGNSPEPSTTAKEESANEPPEGNGSAALVTNRPALHIDVQIHIDPTSSAELIDQIFASMAKHLYGLNS